jgi:GNAT superfamily N-acetyltransferase
VIGERTTSYGSPHDADVTAGRAEQVKASAFTSMYGHRAAELDGTLLLRAPETPESPMLNRIVGLGSSRPATEAALDSALEAMGDLRFYVSVSPDAEPPELPDWLQARGFEPGWGWMQFRRGLDEPPAVRTELEIVEVGAEGGAGFAEIICAAYDLPNGAAEWIAEAPGFPGWACWLALADGEPAAAAALFVQDGAGYLGFAGTLDEHRGKGGQGALLAARIHHARELGCDALFTETGELLPDRPSASYRNILRFGFEELYVVPNWLSPRREPEEVAPRAPSSSL